jgi:hypothetical protein
VIVYLLRANLSTFSAKGMVYTPALAPIVVWVQSPWVRSGLKEMIYARPTSPLPFLPYRAHSSPVSLPRLHADSVAAAARIFRSSPLVRIELDRRSQSIPQRTSCPSGIFWLSMPS